MNLIPNFPAPAPLPDSPWLIRLFLEQSGWPAAFLALLGLCVFLVFNHRGDPRAYRVLGLTLLVAGALWGLGRLIDTTGEKLVARTRELVAAVAKADLTTTGAILGPSAELVGRLQGSPLNREQLLDRVQLAMAAQYTLAGWAVLEVQAHEASPGRAQTMCLVRVEPQAGGINFSWWLIDWQRSSDGTWRAVRIEPLAIQGLFGVQGG
jgi:hypothetical protein